MTDQRIEKRTRWIDATITRNTREHFLCMGEARALRLGA
jgi:hypothetical protein